MAIQMANIIDAESDDLLPGGGGGDSLDGSADSDKLIDDQSDGHEPRGSEVAQPISATPSNGSRHADDLITAPH